MNKAKKTNNCTFYIVRHGETEWNTQRILQGHKDSPLTENGLQEAKELAKLFKKTNFAEVFSSDLVRAKRTAEVVSADHKLAVKTNQLLREANFGEFEGKKVDQFREELKDLLEKRDALSDDQYIKFDLGHGIERQDKMIARFITFLREVAVAYAGKKVLVVSHGGMMRMLLVHLGFGTIKELDHGAVKNLGYFILESDGIDFFIKETHNIEKTV